MKNKISDLRNHMFAMLEELTNPETGTDIKELIARANATANLSNAIVETAKVEIQYMKALETPIQLTEFIQVEGPVIQKQLNKL